MPENGSQSLLDELFDALASRINVEPYLSVAFGYATTYDRVEAFTKWRAIVGEVRNICEPGGGRRIEVSFDDGLLTIDGVRVQEVTMTTSGFWIKLDGDVVLEVQW